MADIAECDILFVYITTCITTFICITVLMKIIDEQRQKIEHQQEKIAVYESLVAHSRTPNKMGDHHQSRLGPRTAGAPTNREEEAGKERYGKEYRSSLDLTKDMRKRLKRPISFQPTTPHRKRLKLSSYNERGPSQPTVSEQSHTCKGFADQRSIEAILNNRDLLQGIAALLEQDSGVPVKELALLFGIRKPSQLTTTEPSRNFFTNLANNRRDITLADIKKLIEKGQIGKNCQSIFPPVEKAIKEKTVGFKLESTLAELNPQDWLYFLKNIADELLENTFQLPSWKDVAGHYGYEFNTIESFCANIQEERPTVKLFQYLVFVENVPTISTLKGHLQTLNRHDIIRLIDDTLNVAHE